MDVLIFIYSQTESLLLTFGSINLLMAFALLTKPEWVKDHINRHTTAYFNATAIFGIAYIVMWFIFSLPESIAQLNSDYTWFSNKILLISLVEVGIPLVAFCATQLLWLKIVRKSHFHLTLLSLATALPYFSVYLIGFLRSKAENSFLITVDMPFDWKWLLFNTVTSMAIYAVWIYLSSKLIGNKKPHHEE